MEQSGQREIQRDGAVENYWVGGEINTGQQVGEIRTR